MSDGEGLEAQLAEIHANLAACLELPLERTASRWIGEAEAVAGDLAESDLDQAVIADRLGHVQELLAEVEDTGHETASEHVDRAATVTAAVLERLS